MQRVVCLLVLAAAHTRPQTICASNSSYIVVSDSRRRACDQLCPSLYGADWRCASACDCNRCSSCVCDERPWQPAHCASTWASKLCYCVLKSLTNDEIPNILSTPLTSEPIGGNNISFQSLLSCLPAALRVFAHVFYHTPTDPLLTVLTRARAQEYVTLSATSVALVELGIEVAVVLVGSILIILLFRCCRVPPRLLHRYLLSHFLWLPLVVVSVTGVWWAVLARLKDPLWWQISSMVFPDFAHKNLLQNRLLMWHQGDFFFERGSAESQVLRTVAPSLIMLGICLLGVTGLAMFQSICAVSQNRNMFRIVHHCFAYCTLLPLWFVAFTGGLLVLQREILGVPDGSSLSSFLLRYHQGFASFSLPFVSDATLPPGHVSVGWCAFVAILGLALAFSGVFLTPECLALQRCCRKRCRSCRRRPRPKSE